MASKYSSSGLVIMKRVSNQYVAASTRLHQAFVDWSEQEGLASADTQYRICESPIPDLFSNMWYFLLEVRMFRADAIVGLSRSCA